MICRQAPSLPIRTGLLRDFGQKGGRTNVSNGWRHFMYRDPDMYLDPDIGIHGI
jgi:hypothetical protein